MGDVDDLVAFYEARLNEDEAAAKDALEDLAIDGLVWLGFVEGHWKASALSASDLIFDHLERCDPARVLREVAAKRAGIERYKRACGIPESVSGFVRGQDDGYRQACLDGIKDGAAVYDGHPDYRQEWKP